MTQDTMTTKKENTASAQPGVPAAKEKETVKERPPLSPEHEALVSGMYDHLVKTIRDYNPGADFAQIDKAYHYAKDHHCGQLRKDGTPFITHPLAVAQIIAEELRLDSESIEAALMHDCIEDTDATYAEIAKEFSPAVADLVEGVSKLTRVQYASKEEEQMENLRKMLMAMAKDIRVILIKLADRTHNMRTMEYQTAEKQRQKSLETMEIYAPIAHRLGMQRIKWELEDLSLKYLDPVGYEEITRSLEAKQSEHEAFMERVQEQIETRLKEQHVPYLKVYGRMKHPYSIYRKMYAQNKTMDEVLDLFAFRVIVDTVADCYNVLGIIHSAVGSTDMHAQTQQHQDGKKDKVIQFIEILERKQQIVLNNSFTHISALKKYDGLSVDHALKIALAANEEALTSDGRLNAKYILPRIDEYYLGQLLYFLMLSVAYEGELADVDAYDQPGVETYKHIMKQKMSQQ